MSKMGQNELDKLRGLVEILLVGDVVPHMITIGACVARGRVRRQIQNGCQGHRCDVEWHDPNGEYLRHVNIELQMVLVEG